MSEFATPPSPNTPNKEAPLVPEQAGVKKYIAEFIKEAPGGVVGKIAAESTKDKPSDFWSSGFQREGFFPKGETLTVAKDILVDSPTIKEKNDRERIIDLSKVSYSGPIQFDVVSGRGLQISRGNEVISPLTNFRADNLLLGLYAANSRSDLSRKQAALRPTDITVRYPHNTGEVTLIKMRSDFANHLTEITENAIITNRGKL